MMSKKWTFSLTIFVTLLALAFVVSSATAGVLGDKFKTTIMLKGTLDTAATPNVLTGPIGDNVVEVSTDSTHIAVVFEKKVNLHTGAAVSKPAAGADMTAYNNYVADFAAADIKAMAFNKVTGATTEITVAVDAITRDPTTVTTDPWAMYDVTLGAISLSNNHPMTVLVTIGAGGVLNADPADVLKAGTGDDTLGKNDKASLQFDVVPARADDDPEVVSVVGLPSIVLGPSTHEFFSFTVTLSEKPKEFKKDKIDASNATVSGDPVFAGAMAEGTAGDSTETTNLVYKYLVTIKPKYEAVVKDDGSADIVVKIKSFEDVSGNKSLVSDPKVVKVNSDANRKVGQYGTVKNLPKDVIVPANGYLVVVKDAGESKIRNPGDAKHGTAQIARRSNAKDQTYNLTAVDLGVNLEGFLIRGGTIDIVSPNAGLVITEIMWGTDIAANGAVTRDRQWIEIANTTSADIKFGDKTHKIILYEANEVFPDMAVAANNIVDRVSTLYKGTNIWPIAGKGQPGKTSEVIEKLLKNKADDNVAIDIEVIDTDRLISMERVMNADGTYADGTMESSWGQSALPSQNFTDAAQGLIVGSPGADPINRVADPVPTPDPDPIPVAKGTEIDITEIMVDTGNGRFPQWIELTSSAVGEVSLEGWEMVIDNAIDAEVLGGGNAITVDLSGVTLDVSADEGNLGKGQSVLVVAWAAQRKSDNIRADRVINLAKQLKQTSRYQLLSYNGFRITLVPPRTGATIGAFGDIAGNLHEDWEIPMDGRSSLIRDEMDATGMEMMGTDLNGWVLASSTALITGQPSYYGDDEDAGTPGQDAGGPLPVELSHFRPARDKATGAVVITWSTQSELNNAGFFIKRSQQRDGEFKVINATMIAGAGTTSEKQFYTYTDTTAQPNIVYYYQIEDVSLDGNRQTLTRGIRLKGHIGAAGKLTSTWGELKASNE